jgi:regulator of protease activity HflC (stomatin/prohibitin superfamily)
MSNAGFIGGVAALGVVGLVGITTIGGSFYNVHATERGVLTRNGAFVGIAQPGMGFKVPFIDGVDDISLTNRILTLKNLEVFTSGNQPQHVDVDFVVDWIVPEANVEQVWRIRGNVEALLASLIVARAKAEIGTHRAEELPGGRARIQQAIFERVKPEAMERYGILINDLRLDNFDYSKEFRDAVNTAAIAQQRQAQVETEAKTREDAARGEANAAIQAARGRADSAVAEAKAKAQATELQAAAEARSIALRGEAEAGAIRAQAAALGAAGDSYVRLRQAERWDGAMPRQIFGGSGPTPMMMLPGSVEGK